MELEFDRLIAGGEWTRFGKYEPIRAGVVRLAKVAHYGFVFPNGYGADVIQSPYSLGGPEGLYSLAVLVKKRNSKGKYRIDNKSKIAPHGGVGYLTIDVVAMILAKIEALPPIQGEEVK